MNAAEAIDRAKAVLCNIRANVGPSCVIAGGFVRDTLCGVEFNDIDVFCPYGTFDAMVKQVMCPDYDRYAAELTGSESDDISQQTKGLAQKFYREIWPEWFETHHVNIIEDPNRKLDPRKLVGRFDFGINQAWISCNEYGVSDAFKTDYRNKSITVTNTETASEARKFYIGAKLGWE